MSVIDRIPYYSNEMMQEYCERLRRVVLDSKEVTIGRGKSSRVEKVLKYKTPQDAIDRIVDSCKYYKTLNEKDMDNKLQLRDYQKDIIIKGSEILKTYKFLYLAMEVRTGKTLTSLGIAEKVGAKKVLFVTKKKAMSSIVNDYELQNPNFHLSVINYESLHTIMYDEDWDLVILDEAHSCFVAGTLVDGKKIEDISVGDSLKSFNFETQEYEYKNVLNVFRNELTENLIKIKCNGKEIVCTESHKVFTKRGWIRAGDILPDDELQILQ